MVKSGRPVDLLSAGGFLFLRPPAQEGALLPVLSFMSAFNTGEFRIRIAFFTFDEEEEPAATGFRFESPEGEGEHNYYHMQCIRGFTKDGKFLPRAPSWLPISCPAFVICAKTPIALFLGVLVGLYGFHGLEQQWKGQSFGKTLQRDLTELKSNSGLR